MSLRFNTRSFCTLAIAVLLTTAQATAQDPQNPRPTPPEDVIRVYTDLVQTDVTVFDKQGNFVNGLKLGDFQLKVDGKPQPIQAFDLIKAGSNEELQLIAARGGAINADAESSNRPVPLDRGRIIFFFIDDFHLDLAGFTAAKKAITKFIEREMGQNDQVAIVTATGQAGFLQQLTDNRTVLRHALNALSPRSYSVRTLERPPMSEYEALLIDNNDIVVFEYFLTEVLRANPGLSSDVAANIVRSRAQSILTQAGTLNQNTLGGLEQWVRSTSELPGRKVFFFMSNGFLVDNRRSQTMNRLRTVTAAAAKSGVVIYSIDTRGLVADTQDVAGERSFDPTGRLQGATHGEVVALQDGLNALARDTGGRAILNTNDFRPGLDKAVKETSTYYLLAWKPDSDPQKTGRFRNIEVTLPSRPDLIVRVRRGFLDQEPAAQTFALTNAKMDTAAILTKLKQSIVAPYPKDSGLPIILSSVFYDVPKRGPLVATSVHIPGELMMFGSNEQKIQAMVDLSGVIYNSRGTVETSFLERIVTTAPDSEAAKKYRGEIAYTLPATLKPGLYQVRVAARDEKSGKMGTAHTWIEVPDLANKQLALSSLLLAERTQAMLTNVSSSDQLLPLIQSSSLRFHRASHLRFLIVAYNTKLSPVDGKPDVAVQVQVVRDNQPVVTTALRKVSTDGVSEFSRLQYAAEVLLNTLTPGQYQLRVTVIDRVAKQSSVQQSRFEVY